MSEDRPKRKYKQWSDLTLKEKSGGKVGLLLLSFIGIFVVICLVAGNTSNSPATHSTGSHTAPVPPPPPKPVAKFSWQSNLVGPVNPATEQVSVSTTNTSDVTGTPQCYIQVEDVSGVYHGSGFFTDPNPLAPGQTWSFRGDVIVTNEGAAYVTKGGVSCLEE